MNCGYGPTWALGSIGGISFFPIIDGVKTLIILGERGDASTRAIKICGTRWRKAGRRVRVVMPAPQFSDLNDVLMAEESVVNVHEYDFEVEDEDEHQSRIYLVAFDDIQLGTERRYLVNGVIPRTGTHCCLGTAEVGQKFYSIRLGHAHCVGSALSWTSGASRYCGLLRFRGKNWLSGALRRAIARNSWPIIKSACRSTWSR